MADALVDGYDPATRLYEQFAGFYEMDDVDPAALAARPMAADLLLGREVTLRSKVVKQADVVMLCYVLPDEIPAEAALANLRYYEPITSHGSSLSPGIHAALAARLGDIGLPPRPSAWPPTSTCPTTWATPRAACTWRPWAGCGRRR